MKNKPTDKWTVVTRESFKPIPNSDREEKMTTHFLKYEGKKVHTLTGHNGLAILTETASRYNEEGYLPTLSSTKLLFELSASKRKELDDLCAKSVPDLFAVEAANQEVPVQFQTCKHGTPFRYACQECDDETVAVESEVEK